LPIFFEQMRQRRDEAINRRDVVKRHEVNTWFIIAGVVLVLIVCSGHMGSGLPTTMRTGIAAATRCCRAPVRTRCRCWLHSNRVRSSMDKI
jgi:hypothetical protein